MTGFIGGLVIYAVLMKYWVVKRYPQLELLRPDSDDLLATSVGMNWSYDRHTDSFHRTAVDNPTETGVSGSQSPAA